MRFLELLLGFLGHHQVALFEVLLEVQKAQSEKRALRVPSHWMSIQVEMADELEGLIFRSKPGRFKRQLKSLIPEMREDGYPDSAIVEELERWANDYPLASSAVLELEVID